MANADQVKLLIKSHFNDEQERFYTVALQIAASEARQGHAALANDIMKLIEKGKRERRSNVISFPRDLRALVLTTIPDISYSALVVPQKMRKRISRILHEYRYMDKLKAYGLKHRRKILLIGPPGTGKTMTASILAKELTLPLQTIQVDRLVTKFMGETSAKLRQIFDLIEQECAVYFFDEFDAIGGERSKDNDVGEMRRVLNSFLQFIEQDTSDSLIVAATNNPGLLDQALFRRFDDILYYELPDHSQQKQLISNVLGVFLKKNLNWQIVLAESNGLSHGEIADAVRNAIKEAILAGEKQVDEEKLLIMIEEKKDARKGCSKE
ncbi:AAA family ATPase [Aminobacterium sp. UBA5514]|uniref:AAA family ATPase n=1 Tax=Aminobacterium sp. UBA5514 TaxID=1946036 RepID=UPI00257AB049|nr:ATP-binding protein [Aminobacterium sp. UBA5514]